MFFIIRDPKLDSGGPDKGGLSTRRRSLSEPGDGEGVPPPEQVPAAPGSLGDRLLIERPPLSGPPESSFGSLIKKSNKAEHQKLHIFPFLAFLEP